MIERDEILDSKFSLHDRHRFEIKLNISASKDKNEPYIIEYFFFIPSSLNIRYETYTKEIFYSDTQHYIRFKTPNFSIEKLFDTNNELSPYNKTLKNIDFLNSGASDEFTVETIIDEIKLLGSIVRAEIRDKVEYLTKFISEKNLDTNLILKLRQDIEIVNTNINNLKNVILSSNLPDRIKRSVLVLDEYISLVLEEYIADLISELNKKNIILHKEIIDDFKNISISQRKYREAMGYKTVFKKNDKHFLYFRSVLKKYISSALFLKQEMSDFNLINHTGPAIAAGIAMFFALIVTIYAQSKYAMNSVYFITIIVVSYIFKDRIKDWLKIILSKKMTAWLYDRKITVLEPAHNARIGYIKETFSYIPKTMVPLDIDKVRNKDSKNNDDEIKEERVFKYKREISLDLNNIEKYHKRRKDLLDIIRFSVFDFIKHADDANVNYDYIDDNREMKTAVFPRLYQLNLVIKYNYGKNFNYERVRLLLTKDGIYDIEEVEF
jgi:hypothetical protein